jgi:hypothetical protein
MAAGWLTFAGVLVTFVTSLVGFTRTGRRQQRIEISVDGHMTRLIDRTGQLAEALKAHGIDVPAAPPAPPDPPVNGRTEPG